MTDLVLVVAVFLSVSLVVAGLLLTVFSPRTAALGRLEKSAGGQMVEQAPKKTGLKDDFLWVMGRVGRLVVRKDKIREIQANLIKADLMMRAEEYIGMIILIVIGAYAAVFLLTGSILFGILGAGIGLIMPGIVVNSKKKKRSQAMTEHLPEALNILSNGLRAGFSFTQALSVVVREMEGPLTVEFSRTLRENRLGKPMDEALNDMLGRIENEDLEMLIIALLIQRQVGGNLAEVLDSIAHTIRERVRIKGEIRTLTAEGRISAIILSVAPVAMAVIISILNPGYMVTLIEEPVGIIMIVAAVIMQIIGILVLRKMVAIEV